MLVWSCVDLAIPNFVACSTKWSDLSQSSSAHVEVCAHHECFDSLLLFLRLLDVREQRVRVGFPRFCFFFAHEMHALHIDDFRSDHFFEMLKVCLEDGDFLRQ